MTPKFQDWAAGRMELPLTELGKAAGGWVGRESTVHLQEQEFQNDVPRSAQCMV